MMVTEMQTDTELNRVQNELVEKEQAADSSLLSSLIRFSHRTSSRVSRDGTLVSLRGLLGCRSSRSLILATPQFWCEACKLSCGPK